MAIYLITGLPGSGKSYYTVRHLLLTFCDRGEDGFYYLKAEFVIVSNIEGLTIEHVQLDQAIKEFGGVDRFFSYATQEKVCDKYKVLGKKVVYFIDECQDFFPNTYKVREVLNFFEKHRHLGFDIYLATQDAPRASRDVISLAEYELRAAPRSTTFGSFYYTKYIKRLKVQSFPLKKDKFVFDYYKSCRASESQKIRHPMRFMICLVVVFILFSLWLVKHNILDRWSKPAEAQASALPAEKSSSNLLLSKKSIRTIVLSSFITYGKNGMPEQIRVIDPYTWKACRPEDLPFKIALVKTLTGAIDVVGILEDSQPTPRPRPRPSGPGRDGQDSEKEENPNSTVSGQAGAS